MTGHEVLRTIFFASAVLLGAVITFHGTRNGRKDDSGVRFVPFLILWFVNVLVMIAYALLGAFDQAEPTVFRVVWVFVVTPVLAALALIGIYAGAAIGLAWIVVGFKRAISMLNSNRNA